MLGRTKKILDKDEANENRTGSETVVSTLLHKEQTGTNMLTRIWGCNYIFNITNKMHIYSKIHVLLSTLSYIITIKTTSCTHFWNLFWVETICFGQFFCPPSGVFHCTRRNGLSHTGLLTACEQDQDNVLILLASCMTYTIAVCTVKNSWWWTEELSETCSFIPK